MSFARTNDKLAGRVALNMNVFNGCSYRSGLVDQDKRYCYASDFDFFNSKPVLRNGSIKSDDVGTLHSVDGLFMCNLWQNVRCFSIINGTLSSSNVDDVTQGQTKYYTWGLIYARFTWQDLDSRTWQEIIDGQ